MKPKILPNSIESEEAVIGSILIDQDQIIKISAFLSEDDFYSESHKEMFKYILELHEDRKPIDLVTVSEKLKENKKLDYVGGCARLAELTTGVHVIGNAEEYARKVKEKSTKRKLVLAGNKISSKSCSDDYDAIDSMKMAENEISNIIKNHKDQKIITNPLHFALKSLENSKSPRGFNCGFKDIDNRTKGLKRGHMVIVGGYSNTGKTQAMIQMINVALGEGAKIMMLSLEMAEEDIMERFIKLKNSKGYSDEDAVNSFIEFEKTFKITSAYHKIHEIEAVARAGDFDIIAIDYLQLIEGSNARSEYERITEISRRLKRITMESNVCVLALSQVAEAHQAQGSNRNMGFKGSGSIGSDADVGIILRRDFDQENELNYVPFDIILRKNRFGETGKFDYIFDKVNGIIKKEHKKYYE